MPCMETETLIWVDRKGSDLQQKVDECRDIWWTQKLFPCTGEPSWRWLFRPGQLRHRLSHDCEHIGEMCGSGRGFTAAGALSRRGMMWQEPVWCKCCMSLACLVHEVWGSMGKILELCRQFYWYHMLFWKAVQPSPSPIHSAGHCISWHTSTGVNGNTGYTLGLTKVSLESQD